MTIELYPPVENLVAPPTDRQLLEAINAKMDLIIESQNKVNAMADLVKEAMEGLSSNPMLGRMLGMR